MDQDADKPDEQVEKLTEYPDFLVLGDDLDDEDAAKTLDAEVPTTLLRGHDDASPYNDEHALFDESGDENLSSQLAMLESSVTDYEISADEHAYLEDDYDYEGILSQLLAIEADIVIDSLVNQDRSAPPEPGGAVETPSLIQRIARLFLGWSR